MLMSYKAMSRRITGDEYLGRCSITAKLLYHRLYLCSDGEMRSYASPAMIKGMCFPLDKQFDEQTIIEGLGELMARRRVRFYQAEGQDYLVVLGNRLEKPKPAAVHPPPPNGFSKPGNKYTPAFMGGDNGPEPPAPDEPELEPEPPSPAPAPESDSCLASQHQRFGLSLKAGARVLGAYCSARRNKGWCDPTEPGLCQQHVAGVVARAQKYDKKLKQNGGKGVRDYPMYLSKALQEALFEDADSMKQQR